MKATLKIMQSTLPRRRFYTERSNPASYYRGGTSRALIFHAPSLPPDPAPLFLQSINAGDPSGRQLNGMGAGISSLSKICVVGDGKPHDADVTYTFVGVGIETPVLDSTGSCGNMAAAIGPYAYDKRLLREEVYAAGSGEVTVKIWDVNSGVMIRSTFNVAGGQAIVDDKTSIDGVSGLGTGVHLEFLRPSGGKPLLPTGNAIDTICGYEVSCVRSANPCIFVRARDLDVDPTILPARMNENARVRQTLDEIRSRASVLMGVSKAGEPVPRVVPKIALVAPACDQLTLSGSVTPKAELDLVVRFISDEQPHRAIPLTGALCTASAGKIAGSVVQQCLPARRAQEPYITIGHPSGKVQVNAKMDGNGQVESASVVRTARRIFEGQVFWSEQRGEVGDTND